MRGMALRRLVLLASLAGALLPGAAFADDSAPAAPPAEAPAATPEPVTPPEPAAAPASQVATEAAAPKQQAAPKKDTTRRSRKARRQPLTWSGPVATLPSFRVLPDGRTRIVVRVTGNIDVGEARTDLRAVYLLRGVGTIARENRLPLLTSYFRSPVTRVELVQQDSGVGLVIDLREAAAPTFRVEAVPGGMGARGRAAEAARDRCPVGRRRGPREGLRAVDVAAHRRPSGHRARHGALSDVE